jgi:hypothetical protein
VRTKGVASRSMKTPTDHSLAYDLAATDLGSPESVTALVVNHCLAPVRAISGLPAPRLGERDDFAFQNQQVLPDGTLYRELRPYGLPDDPLVFDPVLRAIILFGWLFPECRGPGSNVEMMLTEPGWCVLDDWMALAHRPFEGISDLVRGLFELPPEHPTLYMGTGLHKPAANPAALAELRRARDLVLEALRPVPDDPDVAIIDIGLDRLDWQLAHTLDGELRTSTHRRLVWFGSFEVLIEPDDEKGLVVSDRTFWIERGVFPATVPETLTGLVVLDLSEQLGHGRKTGVCVQCRRLMPLTERQAGRARRGQPVYHEDCREEHRLVYFRNYARGRYERRSRVEAPTS